MVKVIVKKGIKFSKEFNNYPQSDQMKIAEFIFHINKHGFDDKLEGRNKCSDDVPSDDPFFLEKIKKVREHNLWHYHIGIKTYDQSRKFGDRTSEYVLHYKKIEETEIGIVDMMSHPPFKLPEDEYLSLPM